MFNGYPPTIIKKINEAIPKCNLCIVLALGMQCLSTLLQQKINSTLYYRNGEIYKIIEYRHDVWSSCFICGNAAPNALPKWAGLTQTKAFLGSLNECISDWFRQTPWQYMIYPHVTFSALV